MSYIDLLRAKFQFQSGGGFESRSIGNPEDRFSHDEAQISCSTDKGECHMLSDMVTHSIFWLSRSEKSTLLITSDIKQALTIKSLFDCFSKLKFFFNIL